MAKKIAVIAGLLVLAGGAGGAALRRARARSSGAPTTGITSVATPRGWLRVEDVGRGGIPVLFVHGPGADRRALAAQVADLRARRRAIAVDLPGSGESPPPSEGVGSPEAVAADLAAASDALSLERLVLVCHGESRTACLAFAALEPARIAGLLLVDPPAAPWPPSEVEKEAPSSSEVAIRGLPRRVAAAAGALPSGAPRAPETRVIEGASRSALERPAELGGVISELLAAADASGDPEPPMSDLRFRALEPLARGALDEACPMLAAAAAGSPEDGVAALALARCEVRRGRRSEAVAAALAAVRRGPSFVRARAYALLAGTLGQGVPGGEGLIEVEPRPALGCSTPAWIQVLSLTEGTADPPIFHRESAVIAETEEAIREVGTIVQAQCETEEQCPLRGLGLQESLTHGPALGLCDALARDGEQDAADECFASSKVEVSLDTELIFVDPCRHVAAMRARGDSPWSISEETYEPYQVGSVKAPPGEPNRE